MPLNAFHGYENLKCQTGSPLSAHCRLSLNAALPPWAVWPRTRFRLIGLRVLVASSCAAYRKPISAVSGSLRAAHGASPYAGSSLRGPWLCRSRSAGATNRVLLNILRSPCKRRVDRRGVIQSGLSITQVDFVTACSHRYLPDGMVSQADPGEVKRITSYAPRRGAPGENLVTRRVR